MLTTVVLYVNPFFLQYVGPGRFTRLPPVCHRRAELAQRKGTGGVVPRLGRPSHQLAGRTTLLRGTYTHTIVIKLSLSLLFFNPSTA